MDEKQMQLYAITDQRWLNGQTLAQQVEKVLENGATFLQLRDKTATHAERVAQAVLLKQVAAKYQVPFVVNDDVLAAKEAGADGVHIGQGDLDYAQARKILGPDKIIGVTARTVEEAVRAEQLGADYIGVGAVFHTGTKADATGLSRETLLAITDRVDLPVVAVGGIGYDNMDALKDTGVSGVAVVSAIFAQPVVAAATRRLSEKAQTIFNYRARNLIFDIDGTLLDSMPYWRRLAREYALGKNATLPADFDARTYSMDFDECCIYFRDELGIRMAPSAMKQEVLALIDRHYRKDIPMKSGMRRLLAREHKNGSRICLFTASDRSCVASALSRLGVLPYIENIYTVYDLGLSKRDAASYRKVCSLMGFDPAKTEVYEDVLHGVCAAKEAGCRVTAVYDADSAAHWEQICSVADHTIRL